MKLFRKLSVLSLALFLIFTSFPAASQADTNLEATKITGVSMNSLSSATIKWKKVNGSDGYEVYRATSKKGKYSKVKSTKSTSFTNKKLKPGKTYYFKVRAFTKTSGKINYSEESVAKSIKMQLGKVKLIMGSSTPTTISMSWGKIAGASSYEVFRATAKKGPYIKISSTKKTKFTNKKLSKGKTYYYKVRALSKASGKKYSGKYSTVQKARAVKKTVVTKKEPKIEFVSRNPIKEELKTDLGFFNGTRVNFVMVVKDAAGLKSITIEEQISGNPKGYDQVKVFKQKRTIPISGKGTYKLSQEIVRGNTAVAMSDTFIYKVSAYGKSYSVNYKGYSYDSNNDTWFHQFGIK